MANHGTLKGFGFAEFTHEEDAQRACGKNHRLRNKIVSGYPNKFQKFEIKIMVNSNQNRVNHLRVKKRKVFIRKLPETATEKMIRNCFGKYGEIERVTLLHSFKTQQFRRVGHIIYRTEEGASNLLNSSEKHFIDGQLVLCEQCLLQKEVKKMKKKKSKKSRFSKGRTEAVSINSGANTFKSYDPKKLRRIEEMNERERMVPMLDQVAPMPLEGRGERFYPGGYDKTNGITANKSGSPRFGINRPSNSGLGQWGFPHSPSGDDFGQMPNLPINHSYYEREAFGSESGYSHVQAPELPDFAPKRGYNQRQETMIPNFDIENEYIQDYQNQYRDQQQDFQPRDPIHHCNSNDVRHQKFDNNKTENFFVSKPGHKGSHFSTDGSSRTFEDHTKLNNTHNLVQNPATKNDVVMRLKELRKQRDLIDKEIDHLEQIINNQGGDPRINGYAIDGILGVDEEY